MKPVLKSLAALILLALPWLGYCAPPPVAATEKPNIDASIRAALALASAQSGQRRPEPTPVPASCPCGCKCGADCACASGQPCGDPACSCLRGKVRYQDDIIVRSIRENRPLLIWVNQVCPPCEKKMPEYLHVRVPEFRSDSGELIKDSCVVVTKPDVSRAAFVAVIPGIPDDLSRRVRDALNPPRRVFFSPPPRLVFVPAAPMMGGCVGRS